jgi:hypothetical protein
VLGLFFIGSPANCRAEIVHGTAIITIATEDFAVVAADSLSTGRTQNFQFCKIATSGKNGAAFAAGMTDENANYAAEGASILKRERPRNADDFDKAVRDWGQWTKDRLEGPIWALDADLAGMVKRSGGTNGTLISMDSSSKLLIGLFDDKA